MDKVLILILNHYPFKDVKFHLEWHQQICDAKTIWQTDQKTDHPDIITIDVPGTMMVANVTRVLAHYAVKFPQYDYFCFMAGDCFIIRKNFLSKTIQRMKLKGADACFSDIHSDKEHYKTLHYPLIVKHYGIPRGNIVFSYNICTVIKREVAKFYNKRNWFKIYDECDFINLVSTQYKIIKNPYINIWYFTAGKAFVDGLFIPSDAERMQREESVFIIHAIKNYKQLEDFNITLR